MKNKYVFDTSFLSSLLNTKDVNHKDSLRIFMRLPDDLRIIIPASVRIEMAVYKQQRPIYSQISFQELFKELTVEYVDINDEFINSFEKFVAATKLPLKAIDYTVLFSCIETNSKLLTFDKKLEKYYLKALK